MHELSSTGEDPIMKVAVILALTISCVVGRCNVGWLTYDNMCYGFFNDLISWFDAASLCQLYGGNLLTIQSRRKQDWIASQLGGRNFRHVWTGARRRYNTTHFEWMPSLKPVNNYTNWKDGEPDNPVTQLCLYLGATDEYKWLSETCTRLNVFVCEKRPAYGLGD